MMKISIVLVHLYSFWLENVFFWFEKKFYFTYVLIGKRFFDGNKMKKKVLFWTRFLFSFETMKKNYYWNIFFGFFIVMITISKDIYLFSSWAINIKIQIVQNYKYLLSWKLFFNFKDIYFWWKQKIKRFRVPDFNTYLWKA